MLNQEKDTNDFSEDEVIFQTKIFDVVQRYQTGLSGERHKRYVVRNKGAVAILPIMPDGRIILIKQFRSPAQKYIWEIPAGTRELNEDPLHTANRELIEETGYKAGNMTLLYKFFSSPGIFQEYLYLYKATDLVQREQQLEDGEDLTLYYKTKEEVLAMLKDGTIEDAKTILALLTLFAEI